ncbi:unnamed protein product [Prorocentrum cordatum]|uniref:Uncharacterized protein n=1 Tax=Prorocentrum cordatum TaxID=2364126 RepID=A0ABN9SBP8_9DINO|nr:unnamed protein product [Polarella glacialis]
MRPGARAASGARPQAGAGGAGPERAGRPPQHRLPRSGGEEGEEEEEEEEENIALVGLQASQDAPPLLENWRPGRGRASGSRILGDSSSHRRAAAPRASDFLAIARTSIPCLFARNAHVRAMPRGQGRASGS